ncbi:hypothetical protein V5N11_000641 [Cardamine amara subsp. amara]|uniref:EF-hand domain-containing protein n=1 Tax=Cardamine amara subsp. amara TaxID=228776 RepID=A0ABD1B9N4_CARAN
MASSGGENSMSGDESEGKGKISEYEKQRFAEAAKALLDPSLNSRKRRGKRNSGEEDDDYRPDEEEIEGNSTSKRKKKTSASKRTLLSKRNLYTSHDDDLDKAIALSLQDSVAGNTPTKKVRKEFMSKTQMTQDELLIYFYQFDEAAKGFIALRDVAKMATVHDFTWTQEELQDMIRCFDMDKDGKLSLDEFRKIVTRCRMLKQS